MKTVEYFLRPQGPSTRRSEDGSQSVFVGFDLLVERRGELLGGNHLQATIRSPNVPDNQWMAAAGDAILSLPLSGWLVIPRAQFAEQPGMAASIIESAATDLDVLIVWGTAQPPETHESAFSPAAKSFAKKFFTSSIRAVGPDYWR